MVQEVQQRLFFLINPAGWEHPVVIPSLLQKKKNLNMIFNKKVLQEVVSTEQQNILFPKQKSVVCKSSECFFFQSDTEINTMNRSLTKAAGLLAKL